MHHFAHSQKHFGDTSLHRGLDHTSILHLIQLTKLLCWSRENANMYRTGVIPRSLGLGSCALYNWLCCLTDRLCVYRLAVLRLSSLCNRHWRRSRPSCVRHRKPAPPCRPSCSKHNRKAASSVVSDLHSSQFTTDVTVLS